MGIKGAEMCKKAADMALMDDDIEKIYTSIMEARRIFDNLKKSIIYYLNGNMAEIFVYFASLILVINSPLTNYLTLAISIGSDIYATISYAFETFEEDVYTRNPRKLDENVLSLKMFAQSYF